MDNLNKMQFRLDTFEIIQSVFNKPPSKITKKSKGGVHVSSKYNIDLEKNLYSILLIIEFEISYRNTKINLGSITTVTNFCIKNINNYFKKNKQPKQDPKFLSILYGIAFSTTRGSFFVLSNAALGENLVLPLINPNDLITKIVTDTKLK